MEGEGRRRRPCQGYAIIVIVTKRSAVTATVSDSDIMVRKAEPTVKQEGRAHLSRSYDSHPLRLQQHGSEQRGRRSAGSREAGAQGRIKSLVAIGGNGAVKPGA